MDQTSYFIDYGLPALAAAFFIFLAIKYFQYWMQVKKAIIESGMQWPIHSQKELNETTHANLSKGYRMMFTDFGQAFKMLFTMRTENPAILKPLRAMRRTLLAFILLPILFAILLVGVLAFLAV